MSAGSRRTTTHPLLWGFLLVWLLGCVVLVVWKDLVHLNLDHHPTTPILVSSDSSACNCDVPAPRLDNTNANMQMPGQPQAPRPVREPMPAAASAPQPQMLWQRLPNTDVIDSSADIKHVDTTDVDVKQLQAACLATQGCVAFNTNGWLKRAQNPTGPVGDCDLYTVERVDVAQPSAPPPAPAPAPSPLESPGPSLPSNTNDGDDELSAILREAAARSPWPKPYSQAIMIAETNSGFHEMTLNWVRHLRLAEPPIENYVIFSLDEEEHKRLTSLGIRSYFDTKKVFVAGAQEFRAKEYNKIVHHKWHLVREVMRRGFEVFLSDVDVIWLRNPFPFLLTLNQHCDFLGSTDDVRCTQKFGPYNNKGWNWEGPEPFTVWINTGIIYLRNTEQTRALVDAVIAQPPEKDADDQHTFNMVFENMRKAAVQAGGVGAKPVADVMNGECSHYGALRFHVLSPNLFMVWPMLEQKHPDKTHLRPFAVHFNYLGNFHAKRSALQRVGYWNPTL